MSNTTAWGAAIEGTSQPGVMALTASCSCATDISGNVYTFLNTMAQGGSIIIRNTDGTVYTTFNPSGTDTGLVIKRNSSGVVQWYVTISSTGGEIFTNSIVVDSSGTVYVGGFFLGASTMTFNTTSGTAKTVSKTDTDFSSFLAKYNSSGVIQSAIRVFSYATPGPSSVWAMKTVGSDLYVLATSPGTLTSTSTYSISNLGGSAFRSGISVSSPYQSTWLLKYNVSGNVVWATRCCEGQEARGLAIDVDSNGGIYIGGKCFATATYTVFQVNGTSDQSSGTSLVTTAGADGFFIKYSSAGARVWSAAITGSSGEAIWLSEFPVSIAASANAVYISMKTSSSSLNIKVNNTGSGTTISNLGVGRGVCLKMLADSTFSWYTVVAPAGTGSGSNYSHFESIGIDSNENVYISGIITTATATFTSANASTNTLTRSGSTDGFVVRFNSSGNYQSLNQITNLNLPDWWKNGPGLAIDSSNNVAFLVASQGTSGTSVVVKNPDGSTGASYTRSQTGYSSFNVKLNAVISAPGAPTGVSATAGNGQAVVSFTAPASNGGSAITNYTATATPASGSPITASTGSGTVAPITITGLTNGTSYTITVTATNAVNTGPDSASTTVTPLTVPGAPTAVTAVPESLCALVSWTQPTNNGSVITKYIIKVLQSGSIINTIEINGAENTGTYVYGLTNGTAYTFTVTAHNIAGDSIASSPSSPVTPVSNAPTTAVIDAIATGNPAPITTYIDEAPTSTPAEKADLTIEMRTSLNAATVNSTTEQKVESKLAYIDGMRDKIGADNFTIPTDKFTEFIHTLKAVSAEPLMPNPIVTYVPQFIAQSATIDLSNASDTSYVHFEAPIGYTIVLQNGTYSISLTYNGTNYSDGTNTYTTGSVIVLGNKTFTLVGIGSGIFEVENTSDVICITKGSMVQTPVGEIAVELLRTGDAVLTGDGRVVHITKMKQIVVVASTSTNVPYVIERNAFGTGVPPNRLEVSPRHAIQLPNGLWEIPREAAKDNKRVYQNEAVLGKTVVYYHYALPNYESDTTIVNGQITEVLNDGLVKESYAWNQEKRGYVRTIQHIQKRLTK